MSRTATAYRIVAWVVGLNLIFVITAWIAQLSTSDLSWWNRNDGLIAIIDMVHGYLFMALLVLIAVLARRHRWQPLFVITTALFATIPLVSFWAEHRATRSLQSSAPAGDGLPG